MSRFQGYFEIIDMSATAVDPLILIVASGRRVSAEQQDRRGKKHFHVPLQEKAALHAMNFSVVTGQTA